MQIYNLGKKNSRLAILKLNHLIRFPKELHYKVQIG